MFFQDIDFSQFKGREENLKQIIRYHKYTPMFYRTNLLIHTRRLVWMIEEFAEQILAVYPNWNVEKSRTLASIHDDPEIITGDIQFGSKLNMSKDERKKLSNQEIAAIDLLKEKFPETINNFSYSDLLYEYENLQPDNLEGTIVKYFDKLDAFCEAYHELFAGNTTFARGFGADIVSPAECYIPVLSDFPNTWPLFSKLRETGLEIFSLPEQPDVAYIMSTGQPHTPESIFSHTSIPHYNTWKTITLMRGKELGLRLLTEKIEE